MSHTRIELTLPDDVLAALKKAAKACDMSVNHYVHALFCAKLGLPAPNPVQFDIAAPADFADLRRVPEPGETQKEAEAAEDRLDFIKDLVGRTKK